MFVTLTGVMVYSTKKGSAQSLPHEVFWVRSAR
jgi:hypothetical protein